MLYFLDARYDVKGAPDENFAREVIKLFTMGIGNYAERDIRESRVRSPAGLRRFHVQGRSARHDAGAKSFWAPGNFDVVDVGDHLPAAGRGRIWAAEMYRFLMRDELWAALKRRGVPAARRRLRGGAAVDGHLLVAGLLRRAG